MTAVIEEIKVSDNTKTGSSTKVKGNTRVKSTAYDVALVGLMVAFIEVCKVAMMNIPNVEMTTFLLVMFTLFFG